MCKIFVIATLAALASLPCGVAISQSVPPAMNSPTAMKSVPAYKPIGAAPVASEPSIATGVENWTEKQWNAAKAKWSEDKAKWNACNKDATHQKLSGRKSWSYLYDCMTKA